MKFSRKQGANGQPVQAWRCLVVKYDQHGRAVRESSKSAKETVARRLLRSREGDVEHGVTDDPKRNRITFDEALADFLTEYETNKRKTAEWTKRRVNKHLKPYFEGRLLANINPSDVRAYTAAQRLQGGAKGPAHSFAAASTGGSSSNAATSPTRNAPAP